MISGGHVVVVVAIIIIIIPEETPVTVEAGNNRQTFG